MTQAEFDGIGFDVRGNLVHEAFVREGILQTRGRAQRAGPEGRDDVVREDALALDGAGAAAAVFDAAGDIRGNRVAAVVEARAAAMAGSAARNGSGSKPDEQSGDDVAGALRRRGDCRGRATTIRGPRR